MSYRVAAAGFLCVLLSACQNTKEDMYWCAIEPDGKGEVSGWQACHDWSGLKICPFDLNAMQCFFLEAELVNLATEAEKQELLRALNDALRLPIEELRKQRYSHADENLTFSQKIGRSYSSSIGIKGYNGILSTDIDGFYSATKTK